jgi:hypothetical protein
VSAELLSAINAGGFGDAFHEFPHSRRVEGATGRGAEQRQVGWEVVGRAVPEEVGVVRKPGVDGDADAGNDHELDVLARQLVSDTRTVHALHSRSESGWILEVIDLPDYCTVTEPTSEKAIASARERAAAILDVPVERIELLMAEGIYDEDTGTWQMSKRKGVVNVTPEYLQR